MIQIRIGSLWVVLFLIFLVLKLTALVTWSWWVVTAPLWFPLLLALCVLVLGVILGAFRH